MPNMLFASNSISHFVGSEIGSGTAYYDPDRVPYAIEVPQETVASSPYINMFDANQEEWWFHFRMGKSSWGANEEEQICEIVDFNGTRLIHLAYQNRTSEGYHLRTNIDGNSFLYTRYIPMLSGQSRTYDIQMKITNLQFECRVYVNELLLETAVFAISGSNPPRYIWFGGNAIGPARISEVIVADGDTRNARLDLLRPVAVGAYDNWAGPVSSLSDDDPTTGMTTLSPEQNQSTILTPYTGASNISNIVQMTQTVRGQNSPENLQHLIRMNGVDHLTANIALPFSKDYQITDWRQNPATSLPWDAADLVNTEFGFKSKA